MSNCLTLKKSNCKNCYKCIRHCPVKAIRFSGNQAHIIGNECILCGQCFVVCPQNAKEIVNETEKVKVFLQGTEPVIVSLAPSFIANYEGVGINAMRRALKKLGFYDVEETALGASMVKTEYERMIKEDDRDIIISSCCHSVNLLIQKYFPGALPFLADVLSPMQAHCQDIKNRFPNAKTVFIGPCVAKKDEAEYYENIVDAVLTFEELTAWLEEENIELEKELDSDLCSRARFFPTTGGVLKTMEQQNTEYSYIAIDGIDNCIAALKDIENGRIHKCFIEMSACVGSCIGGPVMEKNHHAPIKDYLTVASFAGSKDFDIPQPKSAELKKNFAFIEHKLPQPTEMEINSVLRQMGKFKPSQELNCGSCGYNTCREKAAAICQGKAEFSMCLPYLKEKAESFSDTIIHNTPAAVIVMDDSLVVQQINPAAIKLLGLPNADAILRKHIVEILDPAPYQGIVTAALHSQTSKHYMPDYNLYVDETILYDRQYHVVITLIRDITEQEKLRVQGAEMKQQTVEIADKVIEKQMRIVQEIASLLGETTAETQIALTKLKDAMAHE